MAESNVPKRGTSGRVERAIVGAFMFGVARFLLGLPIVLHVQSIQFDPTNRGIPEASWWIVISASIAASICGGLMCALMKGRIDQSRGAIIGLVTAGVSYVGSAIGGAIFMWRTNDGDINDTLLGALCCGTASIIATNSIVIPGMAGCGFLFGYMVLREVGESDSDRKKLK